MERELTPRVLLERGRPDTPPPTAVRSQETRVDLEARAHGESCRDFRPATASKISVQLVEQTKMDDPDKFKIWEVGGRANTPNSFWREQRQYESAAQGFSFTASRGMPWPNLSHTRVRAMQEKGHMRALLLGSTPGTATDLRNLDGYWISTDGELRGQVEGDVFYWDCDGSRSRLRFGGERQEIVSLAVDGCRHFAALSEDGRRLLWADGDIWVRHDEEAQALAKAVKDQCGDCESKPQRRDTARLTVCNLYWQDRFDDASQPVGKMLGRLQVTPSIPTLRPRGILNLANPQNLPYARATIRHTS